jgi:hypothetical protein
MVAPKLPDNMYGARRLTLQAMLDKNYEGIEPLKNQKYPSSLGVEAAQLADGFAYLEDNISEEGILLPFDGVSKTLSELIGAENLRFVQPIPSRFMNNKNNRIDCFAVYIRYSSVKQEPEKSEVLQEPKRKLVAIKPSVAPSSSPSLKLKS